MSYTTLEFVGLTSLTVLLLFILNETWKFLYSTFIGHALGQSLSLRNMGQWGIVTGATDGIGKAYAEELASQGLNVVLISRSPYKLQNVAAEIESKYHVKTRIIDVDFTSDGKIYDRIAKETEGLEVGVLINNVGMSYQYPEYLAQIPNATEFAQSLINCNVVSVTRMCILVLNQMVERKKGLILNVSSASAVLPTPLMTMYSSTKAFVYKFSEDLALEYAPSGVVVQCVLPGFVATNMSRIKRVTLKVPTPADFVKGQIKTLGLELASAGYWVHKLQWNYYMTLKALIPGYVKSVTRRNLVRFRASGLRYMEKQKRLAEEANRQSLPAKSNNRHDAHNHLQDENQNKK